MDSHGSHPVSGIDYPRTLQEFDQWFATEQACLDCLQRLRWPDGFVCPKCKGRKAWQMSSGLIRCVECHNDVSVVAGTILHGTRKPLKLWFQAAWYVTSQKLGGSALGLKRVLGLNSYQTAWSWLHKMRRAMVRMLTLTPSYFFACRVGIVRRSAPSTMVSVLVSECLNSCIFISPKRKGWLFETEA